MTSPIRTLATRGRDAWLAALLMLAITAAPAAAVLTCDPIHFPPPDEARYLNLPSGCTTMYIDQQVTNWMAVGVLAFDSNSDYDVAMYNSCGGGLLASSVLGAGRTDFVIGDFNNNPIKDYAADLYCYGGNCTAAGTYGSFVWRNGTFLFVDFAPTTADFSAGPPYSPDRVLHVYDLFLSSGSTYYFQFSSTLGAGSKMLLFRNPSGGTYWAGRNSAVFEVSGCTSYTAPSSGYYGLVVVNDVWSPGSYTVGVYSTPQCACADELPNLTPVAVPASPATTNKWAVENGGFWTVLGTRPPAGSDWDLEVSTSAGSPGCPASVLATSVAGGSVADFVVTDFNFVSVGPLAARSYRYSGAGGTTMEWNGNVDQMLMPNGQQVVESWGANDVVKVWDVGMLQGTEYSFQFYATPNMKVFLFRNQGQGAFSTGRNGADVLATSNFTYTAPITGYYGVVVAKDDDQPGTFAMRVGACAPASPVTAGVTDWNAGTDYYWFTAAPGGGRWTAIGSRSLTADWDLFLYGSTAAGPWPDCFSPFITSSEAVSVQDYVVGDFHHNAPGIYPFRAKQYSTGLPQYVQFEWTGPATVLPVNAPAIFAAPAKEEVLRIYESYLVGGQNYVIGYSQTALRPLNVYFNATAGTYWASRGASLLTTLGGTIFTPPASGDYAFVIANDNADTTTFSLRISASGTVDADPGTPQLITRFEGAQPNPGRSDVALRYSLASPAHVRFDLIDPLGRRVWSQDEGERGPGEWSVPMARNTADHGRLPSGLYFVRFEVNGHATEVRRVTLLD